MRRRGGSEIEGQTPPLLEIRGGTGPTLTPATCRIKVHKKKHCTCTYRDTCELYSRMNSDSEVDLIITEHDLDNLDPQLADGNNSTLTTNFNKRSSSTSQSNPAKRPKHSTISNTFKTTTTTANTSDISVTSSSSNDFLLHHSHPHGHPVPAAGGGGGATGEGGDSDYDAEQDADHSDEDGSSSSSSDDDDSFVDPLLKDSKRSKHHHHSKSSSKPFRTTTSTSNGSELPLPSLDYTHISQALAHQPLATNPSQQTISLMQKLGLAATNAITIGGEEGLKGFMNEVKNQVCSFPLSPLLPSLTPYQKTDVLPLPAPRSPRNLALLPSRLNLRSPTLAILSRVQTPSLLFFLPPKPSFRSR